MLQLLQIIYSYMKSSSLGIIQRYGLKLIDKHLIFALVENAETLSFRKMTITLYDMTKWLSLLTKGDFFTPFASVDVYMVCTLVVQLLRIIDDESKRKSGKTGGAYFMLEWLHSYFKNIMVLWGLMSLLEHNCSL